MLYACSTSVMAATVGNGKNHSYYHPLQKLAMQFEIQLQPRSIIALLFAPTDKTVAETPNLNSTPFNMEIN